MATIDEAIAGPAGDQAPPALVVSANKAIEQAYDAVTAALKKDIKITTPPPPINPTTHEKVEWLKTWPSDIAANYSAVIFYISHLDSAAFTRSLPPPDWSYDYCFPCDAGRKKKYHDDSLAFMNSFLEEEYLNLERAKSVMTWLQVLKLKEGTTDSVLNVQARTNMFYAILTIGQRIETKLIGAWDRYKNDQAKVPFMVILLFNAKRNHQLMGFPIAGLPSILELATTLITTVKEVFEHARKIRDYKVLLSTQVLSFMREAQELGAKPEDFITIDDYLKWHEFKVNVDASAKIEGKDLMESAELHYEGVFYAYSDSTCRLKWDRKGNEKSTGIPFTLIQISLRAADKVGTYTGTMKYGAKRPRIRLDFCDKSRDTADFYPFFTFDGQDSWNLPRLPPNQPFQVVHRVFMATFMDEASLRKRAMSMHQSTMEEQVSTLNQEQPKSMTPKDYERAAKLMDIEDEKLKFSWYNSLYYFPVRGQLKNFDPVVFDETLDGKKISNFPNTVYATFHVKIKHD